jgi:2,4-dichlorophenol 6-monooxygenase
MDPRCTWLRQRQIGSDGAILVRPGRFIAWRHQTGTNNPRAALTDALRQILARPVGVGGQLGLMARCTRQGRTQ